MRSVSHGEAAANDWDLNIGRYVSVEAEAEVDVSVALDEYRSARELLREAERRLDDQLKAAGLDV